MSELNYTKCNNCRECWPIEEVPLLRFEENGEEVYLEACHICRTDAYLMDITGKEYFNLLMEKHND